MLVANVEQVPQPDGIDRRLRIGGIPAVRRRDVPVARVEDAEIKLVQVDIAGPSNRKPGQRPGHVAEPVRPNDQGSQVVQAHAAVEDGRGHQASKLLITDIVEGCVGLAVARRHGADTRGEDGRASTQAIQSLVLGGQAVDVRIQMCLVKLKQLLSILYADRAARNEVIWSTVIFLNGLAAKRTQTGDFVQ